MFDRLIRLLFPPKCVLCKKLLNPNETDLCHTCWEQAPVFSKEKINFSFVARWTAVWYYKDNVRNSLLRYKFGRRRSYASCYGRLLAMKLQNTNLHQPDVLVWVPVSRRRRMARGFDQVALLAEVVAKELGISAVPVLKKIRHTPPQSGLRSAAERRANVLGAYRLCCGQVAVIGKRILLADDILTTGSTLSECARVLKTAGAAKVFGLCAAAARKSSEKIEKY